jgi:hypothetical protein
MTVDCELLQGSTVGEELAEKVPEAWVKRDVAGVVAHVTDCESAMVKMGRLVKEKLDLAWIGCSDHRLDKTAELLCCLCCCCNWAVSCRVWKLRSLMCTVLHSFRTN